MANDAPGLPTKPHRQRSLPIEDVGEYRRRAAHARELMAAAGVDGLLIGSMPAAAAAAEPFASHGGAAQPRYHHYLSGVHLYGFEAHPPAPLVVLLPLEGEPVLVVPPGQLGSWIAVAQAHTWIEKVVSTYIPELDWEVRSNWGFRSLELPSDVAAAVREAGLESKRIGISGGWPGMDETMSLLPAAKFELTVRLDADDVSRDILAPLVALNSAWEIARLERAQELADEAMLAFMRAAQEGSTVDHAVAEAHYPCQDGGADGTCFSLTMGTDTWASWMPQSRAPGARFQRGDLVLMELMVSVDGLWMQMLRTWVLGRPTEAQQRGVDTAMRAREALLENAAIGVTGGELWDLVVPVIRDGGFEPSARQGHNVGFATSTGPETFSILPGNQQRIEEGLAFTIHPTIYEGSSGTCVCLGDTLVAQEGAMRFLSKNLVSYDASLELRPAAAGE